MKKIGIIILLFFSMLITAQEKECFDIKNGKFKYLDSQSNEFIVKRIDSIQVDSCTTVNFVYHSKIHWKSECEYEMTVFKVNDSLYNQILGNVFEFKIMSIENNKIKLKTKTVNKKREMEYIMNILD